ncbi:MAG: hypothetical protein KAT91_01210 [Candidatus Aenigmarchaeota archaeon]|nr:hypothetical protein [Candidatus Aenigmarchaeota archaeon]
MVRFQALEVAFIHFGNTSVFPVFQKPLKFLMNFRVPKILFRIFKDAGNCNAISETH